ncbi:MAG: helix-turn-helix domain-containing protein [Eubacterium sp.]
METDYYRKVIKDYRKKENLTQEKLAELLGYDTTYMSHIETGKRAPSIDFFIKFSNLSGISLDYMLCCETVTGTKAKLDEITMRALKLLPKDRQFVFHTLDYFLDRFEHYTEK